MGGYGSLSLFNDLPKKLKKSIDFYGTHNDFFLLKSSELLKKNGLMFIATLNKTLKSYIFAIIGAEYILKWLPIGTHDWNKFLKPNDLINICKNYSLNLNNLIGVKFDILKNEWIVSEDNSVNYLAQFSKT